MSEHLSGAEPRGPEQQFSAEQQPEPEQVEVKHERHETAEKDKPQEHQEHHKHHKEQKTAEGEALKKQLAKTESGTAHVAPPNRALKAQYRKVYLSKIRGHLGGSQKAVSKWIHQPIIDSVSEATGKTVARPSGLLVGGFVVLVSSGYYFYLTKHNDYRYSFTIVLVLFLAGFAAGLLVELFYKLLFRHKKHATSVK